MLSSLHRILRFTKKENTFVIKQILLQEKNISLVICTYNREKFIGEALDSLANQSLSPELFEIIIVNNNCTDNTEQVCKNFIAIHPELDINYVIESNQGLSFARNRGIEESKYDIISYIDDDAYAKSDFLERIFTFFKENPDAVGLGGKVIPRYEYEEPAWMNPYLDGFVAKMDKGDKQVRFKADEYPVGCNMTYIKEILKRVGGFNNKLKWRADDKYIGIQVRNHSDQVYYLPELSVEHSIDAYRTSDENFRKFSLKFGNEEAIRVKDISWFDFSIKALEYLYKLFGSFILFILFTLKGQVLKGKYTFLYRWWATVGYFK